MRALLLLACSLIGCTTSLTKVAHVETVTITWERRQPGMCGDKVMPLGCAYRDAGYRNCTIVVPEDAPDSIIAEEIRHCFGWEH